MPEHLRKREFPNGPITVYNSLIESACARAQALAAIPSESLIFSKAAMRVGVKHRLARHSSAMDAAVAGLWRSDEVIMAVEKYLNRTLNTQR